MTDDPELEGLEIENTPEKNRLRVAEQRNIEAYEKARRSLERTPIGKPLKSSIPTDQLPFISREDWKQNGDKSAWVVLSEEVLSLERLEEIEEISEAELKIIEEGEIDGKDNV